MSKKVGGLGAMLKKDEQPKAVTKPTATTEPAKTVKAVKPDNRKGMTLRLSPDAWRELKKLALEKETTSHALLIEALNDYLVKNNKHPLA